MTVLSRGQILDRLNRQISDDDRVLVISPLLQAKSVLDEDSLDLRLGTHFLLPRVPPQPLFVTSKTSKRLAKSCGFL